ncbi:hypothetical protein C8J38_11146 [Rhizobium sp. PP-WC-2G-219]|nr:hypothetical protein C8J37_13312 [Rhizobium sp. PP-WC-1G-195]TCL89679.1 hypothetical protein C8J38_11146 [Rhizobium sp. PP-WC-2G-219]TCQ14812.1 hypothetical protein C8J33_12312 [Rhizobium sp. PP-CC-3G-465]
MADCRVRCVDRWRHFPVRGVSAFRSAETIAKLSRETLTFASEFCDENNAVISAPIFLSRMLVILRNETIFHSSVDNRSSRNRDPHAGVNLTCDFQPASDHFIPQGIAEPTWTRAATIEPCGMIIIGGRKRFQIDRRASQLVCRHSSFPWLRKGAKQAADKLPGKPFADQSFTERPTVAIRPSHA